MLYFHLDTFNFELASVGVAVSSALTGPYQYLWGCQPNGLASYDMTVFKDPDDGSAYLVRSVQNSYIGATP